MGGQLVFDEDQLENFLITRDRPVGDIVTNTKCQSWVSHMQMQCTIALVSDAQTDGKVSVTPKSWLPRNSKETYYNTFTTSVELAYGSDVPESFLSNQSHKPFVSESSKIFTSRVRVMTWLCQVRVESQKLSSHFESLVCKLKSMSSHMKFHIFSITFFMLWNGAQHAMKWHPISWKIVPNMLLNGAR